MARGKRNPVTEVVEHIQSEFHSVSQQLSDEEWCEVNEELADFFELAAQCKRDEMRRADGVQGELDDGSKK